MFAPLAVVLVGAAVPGCGGGDPEISITPEPVRPTPAQIEAWPTKWCEVQVGMTRDQVKQIMGKPTETEYGPDNPEGVTPQAVWSDPTREYNFSAFFDEHDRARQLEAAGAPVRCGDSRRRAQRAKPPELEPDQQPGKADARQAALDLYAAMAARDGGRACALMTEKAQAQMDAEYEAYPEQRDQPCGVQVIAFASAYGDSLTQATARVTRADASTATVVVDVPGSTSATLQLVLDGGVWKVDEYA